MSDPRSDLRHILTIARGLLERFDHYETTEAAIAQSALPTSTGTGAHGGDIPDPLYATHLSHRRWDETCVELAEARGHLIAAERRISEALTEHPETARQVTAALRAARCSETQCDELAVKDGRCYRHWLEAGAPAR